MFGFLVYLQDPDQAVARSQRSPAENAAYDAREVAQRRELREADSLKRADVASKREAAQFEYIRHVKEQKRIDAFLAANRVRTSISKLPINETTSPWWKGDLYNLYLAPESFAWQPPQVVTASQNPTGVNKFVRGKFFRAGFTPQGFDLHSALKGINIYPLLTDVTRIASANPYNVPAHRPKSQFKNRVSKLLGRRFIKPKGSSQ